MIITTNNTGDGWTRIFIDGIHIKSIRQTQEEYKNDNIILTKEIAYYNNGKKTIEQTQTTEIRPFWKGETIKGYEDMDKVKYIINMYLKQYNSIKLNDILESYDAPTSTGEEILIELFPVNWIDYETETKVNKQYISDCNSFANDLRRVLRNEIVTDISEDNNWAFIYIIL